MWSYQHTFRKLLRRRAEEVFSELGILLQPDAFLVGALKPNVDNQNPVCIEPEDGQWPLSLFDGLLSTIESKVKNHRLQRMVYGDEPSMREKPENIRRDSVKTAVSESLAAYDRENEVQSFCGAARPVGSYYVVPVIQIPKSVLQKFPPILLPETDDEYLPKGERSLIHSALEVLLEEASKELFSPDPGHSFFSDMRSATEIVNAAAQRFMNIPDMLTGDPYERCDLFERLNIISSLFYEGTKGQGSLVLAKPDSSSIEYLLRFSEPVPMRQPRWARKALQMATADIALIASGGKIYGLGRLKDRHPTAVDAFTINFLDHYQWELRCGDRVLLYSRYREPRLPQEPISQARFCSNFRRLFPRASMEDANRCWNLFLIAEELRHGSMIIVAEDAASEAERLSQQGTRIQPVLLSSNLLKRVSGIDGSIILDPQGVCHAVGVILDGEASPECTPSRGSRFNSAIRYVRSPDGHRMAIVFSDDHSFDIIPLLRLQIDRHEVEKQIVELEKATLDNYHMPRLWLDEHRFYVNQEQCERINKALDRIDSLPKEMGGLVIWTARFEPDPEFNDSYFLPDSGSIS